MDDRLTLNRDDDAEDEEEEEEEEEEKEVKEDEENEESESRALPLPDCSANCCAHARRAAPCCGDRY